MATSLEVANGSRVEEGGTALVELRGTVKAFEATYAGGNVSVSSEGISAFALYAPGARSLTVNGKPVGFSRRGDYISYPAR